tara:strand:+ start:199 stop:1680 length:1482 start_codon:yes stop_codon:yes gene_type:complete
MTQQSNANGVNISVVTANTELQHTQDDYFSNKRNIFETQIYSNWVITSYRNGQPILKHLALDKDGLSLQHLLAALINTGYLTGQEGSTKMIDETRGVSKQLRRVVGKDYRPAKGSIIKLTQGLYAENKWVDNGVKPVAKDDEDSVGHINFYVEHLERTIGKEETDYLLDLTAYQVQQHNVYDNLIDSKPQVACVFSSDAQGVGKSTHIKFLQEAIGETAVQVTSSPSSLMHDKSAPRYWASTFVVCEEAETTTTQGRRLYKELKAKTGMTKYEAEIKYENSSTHLATAVPILCLNGKVAATLHWIPNTDRRVFVTKWQPFSTDTKEQSQYMENIYELWEKYDGAGQLKHLLLTRDWEGNGFKQSDQAFKTEAFYEATRANSDDVLEEIKALVESDGHSLNYQNPHETRRAYIFSPNAFDEIFNRYHITNQAVRNIKLAEAGLVKTDEICIRGAQRNRAKYWVEENTVITKDTKNQKCIRSVKLSDCLLEGNLM